jgi:hypothetical protein
MLAVVTTSVNGYLSNEKQDLFTMARCDSSCWLILIGFLHSAHTLANVSIFCLTWMNVVTKSPPRLMSPLVCPEYQNTQIFDVGIKIRVSIWNFLSVVDPLRIPIPMCKKKIWVQQENLYKFTYCLHVLEPT